MAKERTALVMNSYDGQSVPGNRQLQSYATVAGPLQLYPFGNAGILELCDIADSPKEFGRVRQLLYKPQCDCPELPTDTLFPQQGFRLTFGLSTYTTRVRS